MTGVASGSPASSNNDRRDDIRHRHREAIDERRTDHAEDTGQQPSERDPGTIRHPGRDIAGRRHARLADPLGGSAYEKPRRSVRAPGLFMMVRSIRRSEEDRYEL